MRYCPRCGAKNTSRGPVCLSCGQKFYGLATRGAACPTCLTFNPPTANFCVGCGRAPEEWVDPEVIPAVTPTVDLPPTPASPDRRPPGRARGRREQTLRVRPRAPPRGRTRLRCSGIGHPAAAIGHRHAGARATSGGIGQPS